MVSREFGVLFMLMVVVGLGGGMLSDRLFRGPPVAAQERAPDVIEAREFR